MNFSEVVKSVMESKSITKADLARLTGFSYQYISDLLKGERRWHEKVINKFCEALGITIHVSVGREEERGQGDHSFRGSTSQAEGNDSSGHQDRTAEHI